MLYQTRICCNICPRLPGGAFSQVPLFNIDIGVNIITVCHFLVVGWLIKLVALYMKTFRNTQSSPTKYVIMNITTHFHFDLTTTYAQWLFGFTFRLLYTRQTICKLFLFGVFSMFLCWPPVV